MHSYPCSQNVTRCSFHPFSHINEDKRKTEGRVQMFEVLRDIEECPVSVVCMKEMTSAHVYVCACVHLRTYVCTYTYP